MTAPISVQDERRILLLVLVLNVGLFLGLGIAGLLANSNALLANALDNASDSVVYLLSFIAVRLAVGWKHLAARISGVLLLVFAAMVLLDAGRRWFQGAEPMGVTMMVMAVIAAAINLWCLVLIRRLPSDDVNIRAAETFSFNDFVSNGGILIAGALVAWTDSMIPDLVVGVLVALLAAKGALEIFADLKREHQ